MNRLLKLVAALAALSVVTPATVRSQGRTAGIEVVNGFDAVAGEVLVLLRSGTPAAIAAVERAADADGSDSLGSIGWRRVRSSRRSTQAMLDALAAIADVERVEPDYIVHTTAIPNDPNFSQLWGLRNTTTANADIHAVAAWDVSTGSTANVVGVVDTGIDYTHPDLAANVWSAPTSFTVTIQGQQLTCPAGSHGFNAIAFAAANYAGACDPMDDAWHGTHVSGTIGAVGNNSTGVVGVNWTARMMGLKFLDSSGSGSTADAINAIEFAVQAKAFFASTGGANVRVLSNSWGGGGAQASMLNEIQRANTNDVLFVAAAGNNASNNDAVPFYPASYSVANIIAVAATDNTDTLASFSNYGATTVNLAAPGVGILSTIPGGAYGSASGTSMATPHVSGAAALVLSKCVLTTAQLKAAILNNVDVIPQVTGIVSSNGRLDADKAIRSCAAPPPGGGSASAAFVGTDATTQGSWRGVYGTDGYQVVADSINYPTYAIVAPAGQLAYTWAASTSDVRALQKAAATDRLAATWYSSTSFSIDVNLTDGRTHQLALYLLDWDTTARVETIEVRNASTNVVLDSRNFGSFHGGIYVKWSVAGHVSVVVNRAGGNNAVVSGVFFDTAPNQPPTVAMTKPLDGSIVSPAPATVALAATASDSDGIDRVEFYSGPQLIGTSTTSPYGGTWSNVAAGSYTLTAKAFDKLGASATSAPVQITVTAGSSAGATAAFAGVDTTTKGTWRGVYGADGFNVVADGVSYPRYATVSASGQQSYTWAASTSDVRALQKASSTTDRVAATWYSGSSMTIDVNLTDGLTHQVALYVLDWDSTQRAETIDVRDAATGALLDTQTAVGFNGGQYLKWSIHGHATLTVTRAAGVNAVVSGVFFDSGAGAPPVGNSASFVAVDSTTQGTWRGVYGTAGYNIVGDSASYPAYASVALAGQQSYVWAASTSDVRALQRASGSGSVAATWYSPTAFTIDVNLVDGLAHQVALYALDWDSTLRVETIDVRDAATNALLDTRSVNAFNAGKYLKWSIRGHVTITVTRSAGNNAVIAGLFFD